MLNNIDEETRKRLMALRSGHYSGRVSALCNDLVEDVEVEDVPAVLVKREGRR